MLSIAAVTFAFVLMASTVKAQCAANEFFVYNYTNCTFDINIQYGSTACVYAGNFFDLAYPGPNCYVIPTGMGYVIRVYGQGAVPVDATAGLSCIAPGTVQPVSDCNSGTSTVSYSSWNVGQAKIY